MCNARLIAPVPHPKGVPPPKGLSDRLPHWSPQRSLLVLLSVRDPSCSFAGPLSRTAALCWPYLESQMWSPSTQCKQDLCPDLQITHFQYFTFYSTLKYEKETHEHTTIIHNNNNNSNNKYTLFSYCRQTGDLSLNLSTNVFRLNSPTMYLFWVNIISIMENLPRKIMY